IVVRESLGHHQSLAASGRAAPPVRNVRPAAVILRYDLFPNDSHALHGTPCVVCYPILVRVAGTFKRPVDAVRRRMPDIGLGRGVASLQRVDERVLADIASEATSA